MQYGNVAVIGSSGAIGAAFVRNLVAREDVDRVHALARSTREFDSTEVRPGYIDITSDNRMGGWYAYRSSRAALNMIICNLAIETGRRNRQAVVVGLHPGTVDSPLSAPFQGNVPAGKLFTPDYAVQKLLQVIDNLSPKDSGKCLAYDGSEVLP